MGGINPSPTTVYVGAGFIPALVFRILQAACISREVGRLGVHFVATLTDMRHESTL